MNISEKLDIIAENQYKVYDAGFAAGQINGNGGYDKGYEAGFAEGYTSGEQETLSSISEDVETEANLISELQNIIDNIPTDGDGNYNEGKQAEYDRIWNAIQSNGNRKYYDQAFAATSGTWNDETFQPKYDLLCEGGEGTRQIFTSSRFLTSTKVPIRCKNTRLVYTFAYCYALKTIPLLTLEGITEINRAFEQCLALENITIEGEIPLSIDFQQSTKLTMESIESIINALSDTATGKTLTLSKTAVETAFGSTTAAEWTTLAGTKPNWTISLV